MSDLNSCPFCGARAEQLLMLELEHGGGHAVVCDCCGAIGPTDYAPEKARALWNGAALKALNTPYTNRLALAREAA